MESDNFRRTNEPGLIHALDSILEGLDFGRVFPKRQPVEVELGCGDASFLVEYARRHPERNFIGVERLLGRLRKLDRKGRRLGLQNLRGIRIESSYFLEFLLPPRSVTAIHVYFPDPWPKNKHLRRRLINERFPPLCRAAIVPGGHVYLRTDDRDYFAQMVRAFANEPTYRLLDTPAELAGLPTDFEQDFARQGIKTLRAAYESA